MTDLEREKTTVRSLRVSAAVAPIRGTRRGTDDYEEAGGDRPADEATATVDGAADQAPEIEDDHIDHSDCDNTCPGKIALAATRRQRRGPDDAGEAEDRVDPDREVPPRLGDTLRDLAR